MRHPHDGRSLEQPRDYGELRLGAAVGDRDEFAFVTADGLRSPDDFRTPELALLETLVEDPPDSLLVPRANYGVVGTTLAPFVDDVWMTERSVRAARLCRRNAARNGQADSVSIAVTADLRRLPGSFETAALAPPAYEPCAVVEQRLADSIAALEPDGRVYVAAAESAGGARYHRTLDALCEDAGVVDERDDCIVVRGRRPPDFDPPRYAESRELHVAIDDVAMTLVSFPGLFAASELDDGTRALARRLDVRDGERILDLACGYGPLGVYAALTADCEVTLVDDDRVAAACARRSAERSGVLSADVATTDGVSAVRDETFDRVVCNPPTHAGAGVLQELPAGAAEVLDGDGRLNLVHHRGTDVDRYLDPHFEPVTADVDGEYRIVSGRPRSRG